MSDDTDDAADIEFLEYLGSWDESDEEWTWFEEDEQVAGNRPAEDGDLPTEQDDES